MLGFGSWVTSLAFKLFRRSSAWDVETTFLRRGVDRELIWIDLWVVSALVMIERRRGVATT